MSSPDVDRRKLEHSKYFKLNHKKAAELNIKFRYDPKLSLNERKLEKVLDWLLYHFISLKLNSCPSGVIYEYSKQKLVEYSQLSTITYFHHH